VEDVRILEVAEEEEGQAMEEVQVEHIEPDAVEGD